MKLIPIRKFLGFDKYISLDTGFEDLSRDLPLHHIDSSILMEHPRSEKGKMCIKYLERCGKEFRAKISMVALGEIMTKALGLENEKMNEFFILLKDLMVASKIGVYVVEYPKVFTIALDDVEEQDGRLGHTDKLIIACAIADTDVPYRLITLDDKMIKSKVTENHRLRIVEPLV